MLNIFLSNYFIFVLGYNCFITSCPTLDWEKKSQYIKITLKINTMFRVNKREAQSTHFVVTKKFN